MTESKADLILHPVRMRIIGLLAGNRRLTAQGMADRLEKVPLPSLYRHLNKLLESGILAIAEEHRVRGAVERVYRLAERQADLTPDDLARASRDDHMRYFTTFAAGLLDDFARYLEQEHVDLVADGVGYGQVPLYLSEEEFEELVTDIRALFARFQANEDGPSRRRRTFSTIVLPEPTPPARDEEE